MYEILNHTHVHSSFLCYAQSLHNAFVGAVSARNAIFGRGSGPVMMSNLHCNGIESTILACDQAPDMYGVLSGSHHQDAGVICEGRWLKC